MKFFRGQIILEVPENVYYPEEDSLLFAELLENTDLQSKSCLEIGCGSGLLSIIMAKGGANVTAVDISEKAVETTKKNAQLNHVHINAVQSDLFHNIHGLFDLIVFNAPYIPVDLDSEKESLQWAAGKNAELIDRFVNDACKHLTKSGRILLLVSSITGKPLTWKTDSRIIARKKIPWEELIVVEL